MEEFKDKVINHIKRITKFVMKSMIKILAIPLLMIVLLLAVFAGAIYFLTLDDAIASGDPLANVPSAVSNYMQQVIMNEDGTFTTEENIQDVWDRLVENNSRITEYLDSAEEFAKLINAQLVTQLPDTRANPNEEINWDNIDLVNGPIQGIVKFRRANQGGEKTTLKFAPRDDFYTWLEDYNENGSQSARDKILSHFTVKQTTTYQSNGFGTDVTADISERIVQAAQNTPSPGAGYCQKWVRLVYVNAGLENAQYGSAYEAYQHCCVSEDMNNIPVGAAVYGTGVRWAGHVGIYIGNGMVMDNVGQIKTQTLEEWLSWQHNTLDGKTGWLGWGWQSGSPNITSTASTDNEGSETQSSSETQESSQPTTSTTFAVEVATWNKTKKTITSTDPDVSGDSSTDYHMQITAINYQQLVKNYTMPFDLLWAFLVVGESKNFTMDMADLVFNSKMEITVYDNYNKNKQVDRWTYKKEVRTTEEDEDGQTHTETELRDYSTTVTVETETNTLSYALTLADCWCVKTEGDYNYSGSSENTTTSRRTKHDTGVYSDIVDNITNTSESATYTYTPPDIVEKVDETTEPNFVTLFNKPEYSNNKNSILSVKSWLIEILKNNESTQDMVDLIQYLIQKSENPNYENEDFDMETFFSRSLVAVVDGDYIVDITQSPEEMVITDLETLKRAFLGYSGSSQLIAHAQEFLDYQEQYKVNAVFAAAVSISETGAGRAGHAVDGKNNWFNIECTCGNSSHGRFETYSGPGPSIERFFWQIADGTWYFRQGKFTVSSIGMTYCENADAPGGWIENTTGFMAQMFSAAGITITSSGGGDVEGSSIEVANGTMQQKLNYLFPQGVPTTQSQCERYIVSVSVPMTNKQGNKFTGTIRIHKSLEKDVQDVFLAAQNAGFKIYEAGGYGFRRKNNGGSGGLSHHSYGVAIDINVTENYSCKNGRVFAGSFWDPSRSEYSIPSDGALVRAFEAKGWTWGGKWHSYHDYMHFSFTGE